MYDCISLIMEKMVCDHVLSCRVSCVYDFISLITEKMVCDHVLSCRVSCVYDFNLIMYL